jgi:hypothetical protein
MIPDALKERLTKAEGHINAVERKLWKETERGLWSARQALARMAEAWMIVEFDTIELPKVQNTLSSDLVENRINTLERGAIAGPLRAALTELAAAEIEVRSEPFSYNDREALESGLVRHGRYLDALRDVKRVVEDIIAARYLKTSPGDWVRLPYGETGWLIAREGLLGQFLIPRIALSSPVSCRRLYTYDTDVIERIDRSPSVPMGTPSWYWLAQAECDWPDVLELLSSEKFESVTLYNAVNRVLDMVAKAWLIVFDPTSRWVSWEQYRAVQHVRLLKGRASDAIAGPLNVAVRRTEDLHISSLGTRRSLSGRDTEVIEIVSLVRLGLDRMESDFAREVDLAIGDRIDLCGKGRGQIVARDGKVISVDIEGDGVVEVSIYSIPMRRVNADDTQHVFWCGFEEAGEEAYWPVACPYCGAWDLNITADQ